MKPTELKRFSLLEELSGEECETFVEELQAFELGAGVMLFEEGQESQGLVLVVEGELQLECARLGSLGSAGPGSALGALSLVVPGKREATAQATAPCRLLTLDRSGFRRLVEDAPRLACKLEEAILREFAAAVREGLPRILDGAG